MNSVAINKGNGVVYAEIDYDLGGYNYFSGGYRKRGYYISVQNLKNEFTAFRGLNHPSGAARMIIEETKRFSQKRYDQLVSEIDLLVDEVLKESASKGELPLVFKDYEVI